MLTQYPLNPPQVPSGWVYAQEDPTTLMQNWDKTMVASAEFVGKPVSKLARKFLYLQVDPHIKHGAYGIGYPQVNNLYSDNHWIVQDPVSQPHPDLNHALPRYVLYGLNILT